MVAKIHEYISKDQLNKAIDVLAENVKDKDLTNEIIILKGQLYQLQKEHRLNLAEEDILHARKNKIGLAILNLLDIIKDDEGADGEKAELEVIEDLLQNLHMTHKIFKAQNKIRNKLMALLRARMKDLKFTNYSDVFSLYFAQMNEEELRSHKIIRGYTENIIKEYNYKILDIFQNNPNIIKKVDRFNELKIHLTIWKSKFESTFVGDLSVSLVYVGVEEELRFPIGIEDEIKEYLARKKS